MSKLTAKQTIIFLLTLLVLGGALATFSLMLGEPENAEREKGSPFGEAPTTGAGFSTTPSDTEPLGDTFVPTLRRVTEAPVAGAIAFVNEDTGELRFRYIERGTGHVYETGATTTKTVRITNTTIPRIQKAIWSPTGKTLVLQYIEENDAVQTYAASLSSSETETGEGSLVGEFLPMNIRDIVFSPDGKNLFYLEETGDGAVGSMAGADGSRPRVIFRSPASEWLAAWTAPNTIALTTKPSANAFGFLYRLNTQNQSFTKLLGDIVGLTALPSPDGTYILYSESVRGGLALRLFNTKTDEEATLSLTTLPEKCVWRESSVIYCAVPVAIPRGDYPDLWYQGITSFVDRIWRIDAATLSTELIADLPEENVAADAANLILSPDGSHLLFMDKFDSTLWGLRLQDQSL